MFISALFVMAEVETTQMPTTDRLFNKLWHVHTMDLAIKKIKKERLIHAANLMNLRSIMPGKGSTYCLTPFI